MVDLPDAVGHPAFPRTMEELVAHNGGTTLAAARDALRYPDVVGEFGVFRPRVLAALLPRTVCEFGPDAGEGGSASILAPDAVLPWPRRAPGMECRVELGCIVGRRGRDLTPGQAGRVLFGITIMASWTELGPNGGGAGRAAISLGPAIVTFDEQVHTDQPDADAAVVEVSVDGEVRAEAVMERATEAFASLVAEASRVDEVGPGDLFGGGGFGAVVALPLSGQDRGALVEVAVEGVGRLRTRLARA